uniref:CCHC-type domain-containing protein n=1 Tax=Oryza glumipatula TaxID=40148 RepID=A0A0D9Z8S4_9ORYZ
MAPQPTCQTCVRNYLGSKEDPALSENPNQLVDQAANQVAKTDNTVPRPNKEVATRNQHFSTDIYQILANQTQILQEIARNLASIQQQLLLPQPKVNPDNSKDKAAQIQELQSVEDTDTNKEKNKEFLNVMITGMKTPIRAHDCPNFQNSIDKSLLQENSTVKEGSGHKRKTSPSEVDMQDVPQCQTMQPCQDIPKYPTLKSKKIRHVPGLICFICHEIGHYMRHCPQKPYMDALLQANMSTSRMPSFSQGSPNSRNVNSVRPTSPDDKGAKAFCNMCQDIQEKKEMRDYKKRKVSSIEIQERESSRQGKNPPKVKSKKVQPTTSLPNVSGPKSSKPPNNGSASLTSPSVEQNRLNQVQEETNGKVMNLEQVERAGEEQVPLARSEPQYEYRWADGVKVKKPVQVSAPKYVEYLMDWVESQLDDEAIFPQKIGAPFPQNFREVIRTIFKRLFRVYSHMYHSHFQMILKLKEEAHLSTCFKHFVLFTWEFHLIDRAELAPLNELIEPIVFRYF